MNHVRPAWAPRVASGILLAGALLVAIPVTPASAVPTAVPTAPAPSAVPTADEPTPTPSPTPPADTATAGPLPPAATPGPDADATASATPSASATPTGSPEATPPPSARTTPERPVMAADPPALSRSTQSPVSWAIAAAVLLASLAVVWLGRHAVEPVRDVERIARDTADQWTPRARLAALEAVGEALIDAGYSVSTVRAVLVDMAAANGLPAAEVVVLPTALFVSVRGVGELRTGAVSSGHSRLNLGQIDELDDVITEVRTAASDPDAVIARIEAIRRAPAPYGSGQRVVAYALLSSALSVMLGASLGGVTIATALGLLVGLALHLTEHVQRQYQALVTVALSFAVATAVLTMTTIGLDPGVLPSLIAPLITLLPGALLTTGVIELATGQMVAGAGRVAAGVMQLFLLAAGIVAAAALVGVPGLDLTGSSQPLGPIAPWLAVAVFGASVVVQQCGRPRSIPWTILVLYVAYGAQVIADLFLGGVLSAFVGALAMTPVAALVALRRSGPAAFVSFLPGFWLLVPGALGLVGVAAILEGDEGGMNTLATTAATMVAIALGTLAGMALAGLHRDARSAVL